MFTRTDSREMHGPVLSLVRTILEKRRDTETLYILCTASSVHDIETPSMLMATWVFDSKLIASAAERGLRLSMKGEGVRIWVEPALSAAVARQDGWAVCLYVNRPMEDRETLSIVPSGALADQT